MIMISKINFMSTSLYKIISKSFYTIRQRKNVFVIMDIMHSQQQYLYHIELLSIQYHSLRHIVQSRDCRQYHFYSVLDTVDYNWHHAILLNILYLQSKQGINIQPTGHSLSSLHAKMSSGTTQKVIICICICVIRIIQLQSTTQL